MSHFHKFIHTQEIRALQEEGVQRQVLEGVFQEHRDRLISAYCAYIRIHDEVKWRNSMFPKDKPILVPPPDRDWCNAAAHILIVADENIQRYFLAANEELKSRMVSAVLADRGIEDLSGFFVELPI